MTEIWIVIVAAGVLTYLTRVVPLVVPIVPAHAGVGRYLGDLPLSIIAALAGVGVLAPDQRLALGPELIAAALVVAVSARTRNLLLGVLAGVVVVAALRYLFGT